MTSQERQELIALYNDGFNEVARSLEGFPANLLTAHPIEGKWSAAEIVHHLADSETTAGLRLRRLLVEDRPLIQGYDQDAYATHLNYNNREIAPALDAFRSARATTAQLFEFMSDRDWRREGTHSESGAYTAENWLTIYAAHAHNHAAQIRRLSRHYSPQKTPPQPHRKSLLTTNSDRLDAMMSCRSVLFCAFS